MISIINSIITTRGLKRVTRKLAWPIIRRSALKDIEYINSQGYSSLSVNHGHVLYLRSDFWLKDSCPNGAYAHTEGIINALIQKGFSVDLVAPFSIPGIQNCHSVTLFPPSGWLYGISELEEIEYNMQLFHSLDISGLNPMFIYQRYGRNNYAGLQYAKKHHIPFILEYNGSEIWMSHHWGRSLRYEKLTGIIEDTVLKNADLVVGNAEAFRSELINRGVDGERIIIVPNGVDPFLFNPSLDGRLIRNLYKVEDNIVLVSFVGSFGPWHGAELLASCVKKVVEQKQNVRFLFVGDGSRACDVKRIIEQDHMTDYVIMTGMISREMIRYYLAASDILVSPQVPNPDSTPFFGSPTKLFEYMAMGKAIAASDLDQIGEVLKTGDNAILFEAGNTKQLTDAILFLASDPAIRNKLGKNAREAVVKFYTWEAHLQAILDKINVI